MRIDAANARLRLIAPVIRDHGIEYAKGKLRDKIRDGVFDMNKTKAWIEKGLDYVLKTNKITMNDLTDNHPSVFPAVISGGLVNLLNMAPSTFTTTNEVPETMHFDVPRFSEWSTEFKTICKLATVIIMVGQFFSDKKAKEEKKNAEAMEQDNMDVSTTQYKTYDEIKAQILDDENSFPFNTEGWDPVLCKSMASLESDEQPVYVLIKTRILNVVYKLISGKSVGNLGAFQNTVDAVMPRLEKMIPTMMKVKTINTEIAKEHYDAFIAEACARKLQAA
jgi:hypothetical protein